jgi:hypothetical protein
VGSILAVAIHFQKVELFSYICIISRTACTIGFKLSRSMHMDTHINMRF